MKQHDSTARFAARLILCFLAAAALGACASKAKVIEAGAAQFGNESLAAIQRIDDLRLRETSTLPRAPEDQVNLFIKLVEKSTRPIDRATLKFLENPEKLKFAKSNAAWQSFLADLRAQYKAFAAIFVNLEKGSLFAAPAVKESAALIDPLIGQMAAFAQSIGDNPAEFVRDRADIAAELEDVRVDTTLTTEQRHKELARLRQRLVDISAEEARVTSEAVSQCLRAAHLGMGLKKLLNDYDKLSVDDISDGLRKAFEIASIVPGLDIGSLKGDTQNIIGEIKADPQLEGFLNKALENISGTRPGEAG